MCKKLGEKFYLNKTVVCGFDGRHQLCFVGKCFSGP